MTEGKQEEEKVTWW